MQLNFHNIVDLIINSLKHCFLLEEVTIENVKTYETSTKIIFTDNEEKDRKYEIMIFYEVEENINVITSCHFTILDSCCEEIPHITTSFTCRGLLEFEEAFRTLLCGVWFYGEEVKEIL